jgi:hypothetical protein
MWKRRPETMPPCRMRKNLEKLAGLPKYVPSRVAICALRRSASSESQA